MSPIGKFSAVSFALILTSIPIWIHFGSDLALPVLADATPILLAIVGVVMSYIQPKKENHIATTAILIIAGVAGTVILSANRIRSEGSHKTEVAGLSAKISTVQAQNTKVLSFLLDAPKISESDRRKGIEDSLRNEYILSHNPIDPEILAGNRMPPDDWMNKRLAQLGISWRVSSPPFSSIRTQTASESPPDEVEFSFWYPGLIDYGPLRTTQFADVKDDSLSVYVTFRVTGPKAALNLRVWLRVCEVCSWKEEPLGFSKNTDMPLDREIALGDMAAGVLVQKITVVIGLPKQQRANSIDLAAAYICTNCKPIDTKHPTMLHITPVYPRDFRPPRSSAYTPKRALQ